MRAVDFVAGEHVAPASGLTAMYGANEFLLNGPPYGHQPNAAEWRVPTPRGGDYRFYVEFAAGEPRPVTVLINGAVWRQSALNTTTGGWYLAQRQWSDLGTVELRAGDNTVRFQRDDYFLHLRLLQFNPED